MKAEHEAILSTIRHFLENSPDQRFGQALFNLNINQFANKEFPDKANFYLKDIYNDSDEKILERLSFVDPNLFKPRK